MGLRAGACKLHWGLPLTLAFLRVLGVDLVGVAISLRSIDDDLFSCDVWGVF